MADLPGQPLVKRVRQEARQVLPVFARTASWLERRGRGSGTDCPGLDEAGLARFTYEQADVLLYERTAVHGTGMGRDLAVCATPGRRS